MSKTNENKTPLTADENLVKMREVINGDYYNKQEEDDAYLKFLNDFASQQLAEKEKEIERLNLQVDFGISSRRRLEQTIQSLKEEVDELAKDRDKYYNLWFEGKYPKFTDQANEALQSTITTKSNRIKQLEEVLEAQDNAYQWWHDNNIGLLVNADYEHWDKIKSLLSTNSEEGKES